MVSMRSDKIKKGLERVLHRALLYATGLSKQDLERYIVKTMNYELF